MTPEPAQPAESPEARVCPHESWYSWRDQYRCDYCGERIPTPPEMLAATTARPTERGAVEERAINILRQGAAQLEARAICPADTRMAQAMRHNAETLAALTPPVTVAATDQAGEVELREASNALVIAASEYQEAAQQHISDTRYDEDGNLAARDAELSVVALPRARAALATQPVTGRTMGGEGGLREAIAAAGAALQNGGE